MTDVFVGSEAVRQGGLRPYQLRSRFRAIYPDVYIADCAAPSLRTRSVGAWLWSGRRAVLAGLAAAALRGANLDSRRQTHRADLEQSTPAGGHYHRQSTA
jgi:hypothetical protein